MRQIGLWLLVLFMVSRVGAQDIVDGGGLSASTGCQLTGCTMTGPILQAAADNCAAIPYSFTGDGTTGMCSDATGSIQLRTGGVSRALITENDSNMTSAEGAGYLARVATRSDASITSTTFTVNTPSAAKFAAISATAESSVSEDNAVHLVAGPSADQSRIEVEGGSGTQEIAFWDGDGGTLFFHMDIENQEIISIWPLRLDDTDLIFEGSTADTNETTITAADPQQDNRITLPDETGEVALEDCGTTALTDATATNVVDISIPQTALSNYAAGHISYTVFCDDETNQATQSGRVQFACHNLAGTESCGFGTVDVVSLGDGTAAIVTTVFTAAGGTDQVDISMDSDCTGVTPSTLTAQWCVVMQQPNTVTAQ